MASQEDVRRLALSLPEACEAPHFHLTSFRVRGKIFATMGEGRPLMLKVSPEDQANLVADDPARISPVPGAWGRKGSTFVEIESLPLERLETLVGLAWAGVAPRALLKGSAGA